MNGKLMSEMRGGRQLQKLERSMLRTRESIVGSEELGAAISSQKSGVVNEQF